MCRYHIYARPALCATLSTIWISIKKKRVENDLSNFAYKVHGRVESGIWLQSFRRNLLLPYLELNHEDEGCGFLRNAKLRDVKSLMTLIQL